MPHTRCGQINRGNTMESLQSFADGLLLSMAAAILIASVGCVMYAEVKMTWFVLDRLAKAYPRSFDWIISQLPSPE